MTDLLDTYYEEMENAFDEFKNDKKKNFLTILDPNTNVKKF
jgi:hypothetical protein